MLSTKGPTIPLQALSKSISSLRSPTMPLNHDSGQGRELRPVSSRTTKRGTSSTSSQRIRNNFLRKIGVSMKAHNDVSVSERSARDIRDTRRLNEPLQYDHQDKKVQQEQRRSFRSQSPSSVANDIPLLEPGDEKKKQVNFCEAVTVVLIPKSSEYSSRVQTRLFHDSVELSENLARNLVEFNAEKCDWFHVCLEEDMHVCGHTGELIHPVHIQQNLCAFGSPEGPPQPYSLLDNSF